jgi:WD40 repeat protein
LGRLVLLVLLLAAAWTGWLLWPARPLTRLTVLAGQGQWGHCDLTPDHSTLVAHRYTLSPHQNGGMTFFDFQRTGPVQLLDLSTGRERARLFADDLDATIVHGAPDGSWLLVANTDGRLRLVDTATGQDRASIRTEPPGRGASTLAPDGRTLALAGKDHQVRVWDAVPGRITATLPAVNPSLLAFTRDSHTLFTAGPATTDDIRPDNTRPRGVVRAWDVASGKLRATLDLPPFASIALAPSPDGRRLALYRSGVPTDSPQAKDKNWWFAPQDWRSHHSEIEPGALELWDIRDGQLAVTVATYPDAHWLSHLESSPDGRLLVVRTDSGSQLLWDMTRDPPQCADALITGTSLVVQSPAGGLNTQSYPVFAPEGGRMLVPSRDGDPRVLELRDTADGSLRAVCRLRYPAEGIVPVFSPDGRTFAVFYRNQQNSLDQVKEWLHDTFHLLLALSPRHAVQLFDTETGQERGFHSGTGDNVRLLGLSPDGNSFWTQTPAPDPLVERWAVPSPWPPAWLLTVTAFGVLLAVADRWRWRRRRVAAAGTGGPTA